MRQGRRAERQGRLSGSPLPKGGISLRAPLAAVGSGQVAPLPALGVRSSHAGGSGSALPRSETRIPDYIAGATPQGFPESGDHFHRDIVFPALYEADIVAVAVDSFGKRFLRISKGFPPCTQGVPKIQSTGFFRFRCFHG